MLVCGVGGVGVGATTLEHALGLVATLRNPGTTLRLGVHVARTLQRDGKRTPVDFPFVQIGPGLGYYRVNDQLPGPPRVLPSA